MSNPELLNYIKQCRDQKIPDEQIKNSLLQVGWPAAMVEEALRPVAQAGPSMQIDLSPQKDLPTQADLPIRPVRQNFNVGGSQTQDGASQPQIVNFETQPAEIPPASTPVETAQLLTQTPAKKSALLMWIVGIAVFAALFGGSAYAYLKFFASPPAPPVAVNSTPPPAPIAVATSTPSSTSLKTYLDNKYGFEFNYPENYSIDASTTVESAGQFNGLRIIDNSGKFEFRVRVDNKKLSGYQWKDLYAGICIFGLTKKVFKCPQNEVNASTTQSSSTFYFFRDADVGAFSENYLFPDYTNNRWVIFHTSGDSNSIYVSHLEKEAASFDENFKKTIGSFRFTNASTTSSL